MGVHIGAIWKIRLNDFFCGGYELVCHQRLRCRRGLFQISLIWAVLFLLHDFSVFCFVVRSSDNLKFWKCKTVSKYFETASLVSALRNLGYSSELQRNKKRR